MARRTRKPLPPHVIDALELAAKELRFERRFRKLNGYDDGRGKQLTFVIHRLNAIRYKERAFLERGIRP